MRSIGVGDGNVLAEPEPMKVVEKEIKTVYLEPEKPEQRNVGLQVKNIRSPLSSIYYLHYMHVTFLFRLNQ